MSLWGNIRSGIRKAGKTAGGILSGLSGQETQSSADQAGEYAQRMEGVQREQQTRANAQQDAAASGFAGLSASGKQYGAGYDQATQQALAQTPEQFLAAQGAAAEGQAAKEALATSNQATRAALKAGRTGGMLGGQAALAAAQGAGSTYAVAKQQAADAAKANYAAANTQRLQGLQAQSAEMANRQAAGAQGQAGLAGQSIGAATSYAGSAGGGYGTKTQGSAAAGQQAGGLVDRVIGGVGGIAKIFSDRRLKEDIEPVSLSDALARVNSLGFKYRGSDRPEVGVMAQDLEGTEMDPAVIDTPEGKMLDTRRLSAMNTGALSEHEKRLRDIETIVSAIAERGA